MSAWLRTYNAPSGAATAIYIPHLKYSLPTDFATNADWTPQATDVQVSKDGGSFNPIFAVPTHLGRGIWKYTFTAAELSCQQLLVSIVDAVTKAIVDDFFAIETVSDPASMWPDPSTTNPVAANLVEIKGLTTTVDNVEADYTSAGFVKTNSKVGVVDGSIRAASFSTDAITAAALAADAVAEIGGGVWDTVLSGHVGLGTAGRILQPDGGTAQGGTANTITLDASTASATDSYYNKATVLQLTGAGAGQARRITGYVGSTKVATVDGNWTNNPVAGIKYEVIFN